MFIIKKSRKVIIDYKKDDVELSLTFDFPLVEDRNIKEIRDKFSGTEDSTSISLYMMRSALIDCKGIQLEDEEGKLEDAKISVDGKVDENTQKVVFNGVWIIEEIRDKILTAYTGVEGKNVKAGVTQ